MEINNSQEKKINNAKAAMVLEPRNELKIVHYDDVRITEWLTVTCNTAIYAENRNRDQIALVY